MIFFHGTLFVVAGLNNIEGTHYILVSRRFLEFKTALLINMF